MSESPGTDLIIKGARPNIETGREVLPLIPRNFDDVARYARAFWVAKAIPDALARVGGRRDAAYLPEDEILAKTFLVIAAGAEVGMGPVASLRWVTVMNNRTHIWGAGAIACLHRSPKFEDMIVEKLGPMPTAEMPTEKFSRDYGYKITLKRKGMPTPFVGEYTVGTAIRAHLWMNSNKKPWIETPDDQLFWRAFHRAAVRGFADALNGMGIAEIAEEEAEPDIKTDDSFLDDAPPSNGQDPQNGSAVQPPPPSDDADPPRHPEESAHSPQPAAGAANDWYAEWWAKAAETGNWEYKPSDPEPSTKMLLYEILQLIRKAPDRDSFALFVDQNYAILANLEIKAQISQREEQLADAPKRT